MSPILWKNKPRTETVSETPQLLDLADKDFKAAIINMFNEVKETIFKELKEGMTTINEKIKANTWRQSTLVVT